MKKLVALCLQMGGILCLLLMVPVTAVAQDKVVVIPLNSSSAKIPNNTSPCTPAIARTIRWTGSGFEGCNGTAWIVFSMPFGTVTSAGQVWMDRNLGASRVATSISDSAAYGDLYQWGRPTDGHEQRTSPTITTLSSSNAPGHGNFIKAPSSPYDWRSPQNAILWHGVSGINNPCPSGFRLPTEREWETERASWGGNNNSTGAFNSPLKLVPAGFRVLENGTLYYVGSYGSYWSATVDGNNSRSLNFRSGNADMGGSNRAFGFSVRCLED